jgi:hypothetical protein
MSQELAGAPVIGFPPAGPVCDRPGVFLTDAPRDQAPPVPPPGAFDASGPSTPAGDATPQPAAPPVPTNGNGNGNGGVVAPTPPTPPTPPNLHGNGRGHNRP